MPLIALIDFFYVLEKRFKNKASCDLVYGESIMLS